MKSVIHLPLIILLEILLPATGFVEDRITLKTGEIFLGTILGEKDSRLVIDRGGIARITPIWSIKQVEKDRSVLLPQGAQAVLSPTQTVEILGKTIALTSQPPAEPSHLERYLPRSHFWVAANRYLRGYLVNQTGTAYRRLTVSITYYSNSQRFPLFQQQTEIFDVYPMTMKPFIVDTYFVDWNRVDRIDFKTVAEMTSGFP